MSARGKLVALVSGFGALAAKEHQEGAGDKEQALGQNAAIDLRQFARRESRAGGAAIIVAVKSGDLRLAAAIFQECGHHLRRDAQRGIGGELHVERRNLERPKRRRTGESGRGIGAANIQNVGDRKTT
jgi:hypothetical protein